MNCCLIFFPMQSCHALAARGRDKVFPHRSGPVHLSRLRDLYLVQWGTHSLLGLWLPKLVRWKFFSYGNVQQQRILIILATRGSYSSLACCCQDTLHYTASHAYLKWVERISTVATSQCFSLDQKWRLHTGNQEQWTFKTWRHFHAVKTGNLSDKYLRGPDHYGGIGI